MIEIKDLDEVTKALGTDVLMITHEDQKTEKITIENLLKEGGTVICLTRAEYEALPTIKQNAIYVITDEQASGVAVDQQFTPMSAHAQSGTAVQQAVQALDDKLNGALAELTKNKIGNVVDISSYNSESNKFTVPSDGYIITETSVGITAQTYAIIGDAVLCVARSNGNYAGHNSLFVRKGTQLYISGSNTIIIGRFYPLVA